MVDTFLHAGGVLIAGALVFLYLGYRALLPKPLPDIPYNKGSESRLFGDIPEMMRYVMRTKRVFCWLTSLTARHQSPIVQAFIKPFSLPWVVVTDPFEAHDILVRRTKEFDRSSFVEELIGGLVPYQHINFSSSDPRFKQHRNLINQLMAPSFLSQVSALEVYNSANTLVKLWQVKCRVAKKRPFPAFTDLNYLALDSIFASGFRLSEADSITAQRLDAVSRWTPEIPEDSNKPVSFPDGAIPPVFQSILTIENSVASTQLSPMPRLTSWVIRKLPYLRNAIAVKEKFIEESVNEGVRLIESGETQAWSALHSVLMRERDLAAREGRTPEYHSRAIADEFFGFLVAGHDTTATTAAWGLKLLTDNPATQERLRADLRAAMPTAVREKRAFTYRELGEASLPFLDAVIDEVLRHANTIPFVAREATQDTTVLGRHIPKGTNVFFMANGAGYLEPNMHIDDKMRGPGARRENGKVLTGIWDDGDIEAFRPERWLIIDKGTGKEVYDPSAGPSLAFGLGPRGCWGRKLALLALRTQFALIIWHFYLHKVPEELSSYNAIQQLAREPTHCYLRLSSTAE